MELFFSLDPEPSEVDVEEEELEEVEEEEVEKVSYLEQQQYNVDMSRL